RRLPKKAGHCGVARVLPTRPRFLMLRLRCGAVPGGPKDVFVDDDQAGIEQRRQICDELLGIGECLGPCPVGATTAVSLR
ncbi:MAG TPA: hypothetical protein VE127_08315, partial [Solirubrobacteraceae bacterium]|nr:hypothetical protein [Solirubrobacteraceae bacterium]